MAHSGWLIINLASNLVDKVPLHLVPFCHLVSVTMGKPLLFAQGKEWSVGVSCGIAFSGTK